MYLRIQHFDIVKFKLYAKLATYFSKDNSLLKVILLLAEDNENHLTVFKATIKLNPLGI